MSKDIEVREEAPALPEPSVSGAAGETSLPPDSPCDGNASETPSGRDFSKGFQELYSQLQELDGLKAEIASRRFYIVEVAEDEAPVCLVFRELDEVLKRLRRHIRAQSRVNVFVFHGERLHISKGPLRYLLVPNKSNIPLFKDDSVEADETGTLINETPLDGLPDGSET